MATNMDKVEGKVAHDAVNTSMPIILGGEAKTTEPAAVAADDVVRQLHDLMGRLVVSPFTILADILDGNGSATDATDTAVIAAKGVGIRIYVTTLIILNTSSTDTHVIIKSAGTNRLLIPAPKSKHGAIVSLTTPLRLEDNEALNFASAVGVTTMYVSAVGFKAA